MGSHNIEKSMLINASPKDIYAIIADYRVGHQAILPREYFDSMIVEEGGFGAGTVIRLKLTVFGQKYTYHQRVTEPEPGHLLVETDINTDDSTKFIIEPVEAHWTRVTISADFALEKGFKGLMQRVFQPMIVRKMFTLELNNLKQYVSEHAPITQTA